MADTDVRAALALAFLSDGFEDLSSADKIERILKEVEDYGLAVVPAGSLAGAIHWAEKGLAATSPSLKIPFADAFMDELRSALPATIDKEDHGV